ncbi:AMP-binding protein [Spongiibacter sp. KMU-166]|uniref:AMP-binding protein n=1 Tax=Spongiibacter thalassae TaxID=2721624 RepID=A0ABX1GMC1_9GAMM|nr:AMP-binding protein [Spongiibacter thalassae]NKI19299.1 AMP-binding protein [Spongiibacter thalassae]
MSDNIKTPLEMFYHWEREAAGDVFLRQPAALQWTEYTWAEVADRARRLAAYLVAQNYEPGSRIAVFAKNCADWVVVDFAIMLAGHISVPLYPGQDASSTKYIVEHSESRMIFLGQFDIAEQIDSVLPADLPRVGIHGCAVKADISIEALLAQYEPFAESPIPAANSLFTILYTSGTTGNPKGVMHIHATPGSVLPRFQKTWKIGTHGDRERFISYLPLSHAAERCIVEMNALYCNGIISFSEGLETFAEELRSVEPTFFFSVPRLWVKFKEAVDAKIPPEVQAGFGDEQREAVRKQLGLNSARVILTGSAPCPKEVQNWFLDMGVLLREGYSMTENFCDGTFWSEDSRPPAGCVGKPLPGVEIKLTDDEEVCFRSSGLMVGYYKNDEKTAEALVDGWYHTGDTGKLDDDGNLWITGRISEVFKTTKGKFISPTKLEDEFGSLVELAQVCVCGHGLNQPILLATRSELAATLSNAELAERLSAALEKINSGLPAYEKVSNILVTPGEWTIMNGLLTPTMKLKRKSLLAQYADQINASHSDAVVFL